MIVARSIQQVFRKG